MAIKWTGIVSAGHKAKEPYAEYTVKSLSTGGTAVTTFHFYGDEVPRNAFSKNGDCDAIIIHEGCQGIGSEAFAEGYCLTLSLPNTLATISSYAFSKVLGLDSVTFPPSIQTVKPRSFYQCEDLQRVTFQGTPSEIASSAFDACLALKEIRVPWAEGAVAGAPWGATNATIIYNYTGN